MTLEEFAKALELEFEDIEPNSLKPETKYRDIENWNSMYALIVIAFVDTNFEVELNAEDLKNSESIKDLYSIIQSKKE
jgi:acyl carrier protein